MATAIICDNLINGNIADADGTTLDATKLASCTQGAVTATPFSIFGTAPTIQAAGAAGLDQVYLRGSGTNFAAGSTHRPIRFANANANSYVIYTPLGTNDACSVGCWITFGQAN